MKKIYLHFILLFIIIFSSLSYSFATTYYTFTNGSPATLSLWWTINNGTGTHPANFTTAGDIFIIQNNNTMTTSTTWTVSGTVIISSGCTLNASSTVSLGALGINAGGTVNQNRNLTVTAATNISGTINFKSTSTTARTMTFNGDVTINSGAIWTVPATGNGANDVFIFRGNFTNNATTFNDLGTGIHTYSGATKTISGSTVTSIGSVAVTGTVTSINTLTVRTALSGVGTLTNGNGITGTLNLGSAISITTLNATAANNTVNYTGAAQTAKVTTYMNLTITGTGAKTFASSPTVNGVLSMEATGSIAVTTGAVIYGSTATLQYNKPAAYNATTEEWVSPFTGSGGIIIKNTGAITCPGAVQIGNNTSVPLNINIGATLTPGANLISFHGDFINAGTLTSGSGGITIAGTVSTQSIAGFTTTGSVTLTKTSGTATLQGNVSAAALSINGSGGTLHLGSGLTHTFTADVSFTAGILNGGSSILYETAVSTTAWNGNGTLFNAANGTVYFSAAGAQTLSATATTFNNLTISNSGLKSFTNTPTINGVLSMEGTATVSAAPIYGSAATLQYNTSTSRSAGIEWITPFIASGGVVIANTATITMNAAKVFNATAPLTINNGSLLSMSTFLLTLNGNFINNGGTASGTTGGVTITGTATQSIGSFTTTGTVNMTKTGGTATLTGNVNGAGLTVNGSGGTLNLGTALIHTFTGNITLTAGSLNGGSSTLNENNVSATAWNGTGNVFTANTSTVNFGGAGNQTIAANSVFFNLALSGSGNKTFSNSITIVGDLSISGAKAYLSGITTHTSNSLTLGGAPQAGGSWGSTASTATHINDTYFANINGLINVNCQAPSAPTSGGNHTICSNESIPSLSVSVGSGETAYWYAQASGGAGALAGPTTTYTPSSAGTYYAGARSSVGCASATRTAVSLTINNVPAQLSLSGSTICTSPGDNGSITSSTSVIGINYQLYDAANNTQGSTKTGTGSGLSWTGLAAGTGYYVKGTNTITNCYSSSSPVNITTNTDPAVLSLTGSTICSSPGGDGIIISSTSVIGINYQLYDGSNNPVQTAFEGNGSGLQWVNLSAANGYYVISTDINTSCVSSNSNTVNVATTVNPDALVLTGSTICASPDGNGIITSTTSETGVIYQLFDINDLEVQSPVSGTGSTLSWTDLSSGGGYYAIGTNSSTLCESNNSNTVNVSTTPNPTITTAAAASSACFNTNSQNTTLSYSAVTNLPTDYSINWNAAALSAGLIDATTTLLPSSPITVPIAANVVAGTYTGNLIVTNANGCASQGNSFTVSVNNLPAAPTGSASQIFCSGATIANLSATGTSIQWYTAASGGTATATSTVLVNGTHYYASQTVNGCESSSRLNVTAIVVASGSWIGTTSTDWFTTTNWCGNAIPTSSTNVVLIAGLSRYPTIGASGSAVCNNLSIEAGASLGFTASNTLTVSGNWSKNGTFTATASTVIFNGSGTQNIGSSNFNNITFSGTGTKTATGILSIAGNINVSSGSNFSAGAFTHTVGGNWTNSGSFTATGSTIDFNGSSAASIATSNFNNITFSGAGTKTATGILAIAGNVNISNNFIAGAFTHTVSGDWTKTGTFNASGSTIDFNGSGAGSIGASNFNNITLSGTGTKTATGALSIIGNLIISNNFSAGSFTHTFQGNWINNGAFTSNTSTINCIGFSAQSIGGTSSTTFNNFIQNGLGVINLDIITTISGNLSLTLGLIDIGAYNLIISSTGSISGGSSSSYIKTSSTGRLKQFVPGNGSVTKNYPVGNTTYNPMTVKYNDISIDNFSLRVEDAVVTNANSTKTINRKWYLIKDAAGSSNLTLSMTYNSGEEGSGFSNTSSPQIGYFDGISWAYRPVSSGSGTTTFTSSGSAPDFTNTSSYFVLGSDDAFNATKLAVTNISPTNPSKGLSNTIITIQSRNSNDIPTMVGTACDFSLSATNTTIAGTPVGSISQYTYETYVNSVQFTESTYDLVNFDYDHDATVTATRTSGETLTAGTSAAFDVYDATIWEPVASGNWDATNEWKKSTDGGITWTNPATLPADNVFSANDMIRIPVAITLTANVTASFYSMIVFGTLDINSSGDLTVNHSATDDYNLHVHEGTLKNSGGNLTNNNGSYPAELIEIHGATYEHARNGGSIPVCMWSSNGATLSTCKVTGITTTALTSGLDQTFENFTWDNSGQTATQTLSADMTVNAALTLTAGKITTGSHHVIVGLNGSASNSGGGYINGNLRRYVASTVTTGDFPVGDANYYAPFSITVNSGTPSGNGYIDVSTSVAQPAAASGLSQTKYINRKWTISNNGVAGITTYNPGCTFDNDDKIGSPTIASLKMRKLTSGIWYTTNGAATTNTITATGLSTTGLTATSDFYVGEDDCSSTNSVWLGSTSTDWNTASNWCDGSVPTNTTDVIIPSSPSRQPVIGSSGASCKNITIQSGASLSYSGAYTLDVKGNWTNSGTFTAGTATVTFTGTTAQTISGTTIFNNLTVNNSAGVTAANDITVNGLLTLSSSNPDATHGCLDMGSYTLSMLNSTATVAGNGDVTGVVKRMHSFIGNTVYTFGNQYTSITFTDASGGVKPVWISCKIAIGSAPAWRSSAVNRTYSFAQDGTGTDRTITNLHYLDSELHGSETDETKLVFWDAYGTNYSSSFPRSKSDNNISNNWVSLTGMAINFIATSSTLDVKQWGLSYTNVTKIIWTGNGSPTFAGDWSLPGNWNGGVPTANDDVLIPSTLPGDTHGYPYRNLNPLSAPAICKTLEIGSGASVTVDTYDITITGDAGAWINNGSFTPGTGTVYFTHGNINDIISTSGTTQFNNLNIGPTAHIRPSAGSYIKISGNVVGDINSIVDLSSFNTTVEYNGTNQYIVNPSTIGFPNRGYYNLIINGTGAFLVDDLDIAGDFTSYGDLAIGTGTVSFIGTTPQIIGGTVSPTFYNLTINNASGVSSAIDLTVDGILNLQSDNPSLFAGTLAIGSTYTLTMGINSTTTGLGDVTGVITRNFNGTTTPLLNTEYSYGNQNTVIIFPYVNGQTLPTSTTIRVTLGQPPSWTPTTPANAINRILDVAQTGGSGTKAIIRSHFRSDEVPNGINQNLLSMWINKKIGVGSYYIYEKGKSNISTTTGYSYIAIQDVDLAVIPSDFNDFHVAFAPTGTSFLTWNGAYSTDWNNTSNWTPNGVPTGSLGVIIPDSNTVVFQPFLPDYGSTQASCQYIIIENAAVLNSGTNSTLTVTDGIIGDAWNMEAGGTFNAGNSTVIFSTEGTDFASISGSTQFYNFTISTGSKLRPAFHSYMGIAGALVNNGTFAAATNENTIEFNGNSSQTIINPNGSIPGYHKLIVSGSGTKILPSASLNILHDFINNASGTVDNNSGTVVFSANDIANVIGGTTPTVFNNLTIDNVFGLELENIDAQIKGTLTFTKGKISTGINKLILGGNSPSCTSASVTGAGTGKYIFGNLRRYIPTNTTQTIGFDIGDSTYYTPISVDFTASTSGCGYIDANTSVLGSPPAVVSGLSQTRYINRKWSLIHTDVIHTTFNTTFTFVEADKIGSPDYTKLAIRKYNGSAWYTSTTGIQTLFSTQATSLTDFSDFEIGEDDCAANELWLGGTSSDWNTATNWCSGVIPDFEDNVIIPSGTPNTPHIGVAGGEVKSILISAGAVLTMDGSYNIDVFGSWINNGTFTQSTSTVNFKGNSADTIFGTTTFHTLKINNTAGVSLGAATTVSSTLTIGDVTSNSVFNDGGYQLTASGTLNLTSGTFRIGSGVSATTYPEFATNNIAAGTTVDYASTSIQTIAAVNYGNLTNTGNGNRNLASSGIIGVSGAFTTGTGSFVVNGSTVNFNGTGSQMVNGITYDNLTISAACIAGGDITVNGVLNLNSANASATKGALYMGFDPDVEYILHMGVDATTTGTGDVSGYINRNNFELNKDYTFGNQFNIMNYTVGPLPNSVTLEVYLPSSDIPWKTNAIHRYFDVTHSGGSPATRLNLKLHYLDTELNGITDETNLDLYDYHVTSADLHDHGSNERDATNNFIGFTNVGLVFLGTAISDDHYWTIGSNSTNGLCTWIGGSPSGANDWDLPGNWEGGVPYETSAVVIPTTVYDPVLPNALRTIGSMSIESGGEVVATSGTPTLAITAATNAWLNNGTFDAGNSTVVFTNAAATMDGSTNFNNVTVADGATLILNLNNYFGIAGELSLSSTGVLDSWTNSNMVDYNGVDQTVIKPVVPNGQPNYHNLILSGSGIKTMPASAMYLHGELFLNGTVTANVGGDLTIHGTQSNIVLGSGTTFNAGSFTHSIFGNLVNNGSTFNTAGSTFNFNGTAAQTIGGTTASEFNNLIIDNNTSGVALNGVDATINGTLTLSSGVLSTAANKIIIPASGSVSRTSGHVYGNLQKNVATGSNVTKTFEIGGISSASYEPLEIIFNSVSIAGNLIATTTAGDNVNLGSSLFDPTHTVNRYWTLSNSGIVFTDYDATFTWVSADEDAGFNAVNALAGIYNNSSWTYPAISNLSTNSSEITGETVFGDYQFGDKMVSLSGSVSYYNKNSNVSLGNNASIGLYSDANCTQLVSRTSSTNPQQTSGGNYQFNDLYSDTYYLKALTALSTEGAVNGTDAAMVNAWPTALNQIEKVKFYAGDIDGSNGEPNNALNSVDALKIMDNFVNGTPFVRSEFSHQDWTFWIAGDEIAVNTAAAALYPGVTITAGNDLIQNLYGLCNGDFNRSFTIGNKSTSSSVNLIHTGNLTVNKTHQELDLHIHFVNSGILGAVSLVLDFPSDLVNIQDVVFDGIGGQFSWAVYGNQLRLAWYSNNPLVINAGDVMATLHLKTTENFTPQSIVLFNLAATSANELADGEFNVIPNAVLSIESINANISVSPEKPIDNSFLSLNNYPNPFNSITNIVYDLPFDGNVMLEIRNLLGETIYTLVNENQLKGLHALNFDATNLKSGIYMATLRLKTKTNELIRTIKLINNK